MAEKLCELRKKGGGGGAKQVETVLWTNSAPTSTFTGQDVTLSDDINNYDCLKFTYRVTTSVVDFLNYIISVSDFKKSVQNSSIHNCVLGLSTDDSASHTRRVYYKTDTTVNFNSAYQLNAVASNNATVIPTQIVGIKNMGGWRDGKSFYYPFAVPTQNVSIPIGFVPKRMIITLVTSYGTSVRLAVYDAEVSTTQYRWVTNSTNYSPPTYYDLGRDIGAGSWNFADNGTSVVFTTVNSDLKGVTIMATA